MIAAEERWSRLSGWGLRRSDGGMEGRMEGWRDGGQKARRQFEEFRREAKWQRLHSKYYGSKSGLQQVHLTPHHPTPPTPLAANKVWQSGGDTIGSRRTRGVWMQSLQVRTQLLNSQFSPAASCGFRLHRGANCTPGAERH